MDRRSWPWKKKSSDKSSAGDVLKSSGQAEQDEQVPKFVQISPERYTNLTESEEQVKILCDKVNVLNEKLSAAQSDITTKDSLVKQHVKVAEEAVSGWEKAEAEALALKHQLETVTLSKLAAEERAAHLDGALKECMKQVRTVKEESEQKLQDVVFAKTKQWEMMKAELEAKLASFEQELIRAGAENDALSRSLEEREHLLLKVGGEKAQAESQIEVLKGTILSGEKEISSLKYELHVLSKELEIRNEEKNMSVRSADVATKQHVEDVKKISKLEAECQRLRGLVRKKLPGPAALAQMKLEVDSWGRDHADNRLRRSPSRSSNFHHPLSPSPDNSLENLQHMQKENEFLTARLLSMEDETKMLKEALSKRNNELQASRNTCAKTAGKLRSMDVHMVSAKQYKNPTNSNLDVHHDGALSLNGSNPPSLTSMSEDGVDDATSCAESWANALISELSHIKKDKGGKGSLTENSNQMVLMDDFLEMERLACLSPERKECGGFIDKKKAAKVDTTLTTVTKRESDRDSWPSLQFPDTPSSSEHLPENSPLSKLHSRISSLLGSHSPQNNVGKVLDGIRNILRDIEEEAELMNAKKNQPDNMNGVADNGSLTKQSKNLGDVDHGLRQAILEILDFLRPFKRQLSEVQGKSSHQNTILEKIEKFSTIADKVLLNENALAEMVIALAEILAENCAIKLTLTRDSINETESNNLDCVDKVTLLENKVHHEPIKDSLADICSLVPHSSSDPDFEGSRDAFVVKTTVRICSMEEYEQLKLEKRKLEMELAKCNDTIECTKLEFSLMEKNMEELTSKLSACEKSNSLTETQLKCMAESYKSLELQKSKLESEIEVLHRQINTLRTELADERQNHQDDLAKYRDLKEKIERYENEKNTSCVDEDAGVKMKQDKDIAAAAEKLAECQETILLLGRQLQTLRPPPAEPLGSVLNKQPVGVFSEDQARTTQGLHFKKLSGQFDTDHAFSSAPGTGNVSPLNGYRTHKSPSNLDGSLYFASPNNSKRPKHRSRSSSSSSFTNQFTEKQGRGFSRLFSKSKSEY
uniref:Filament-like plant protein 4 n=1 Tax=Oryza punctata TaxID=4537 RepID=A0A0E0M5P6_ORYPU